MASNNNGYTIPANLDADREELTYPRETEHDTTPRTPTQIQRVPRRVILTAATLGLRSS